MQQEFTCSECHVTLTFVTNQGHEIKWCPCGKLGVAKDEQNVIQLLAGTALEYGTTELPNWFEIPVTLPEEYKNWVETNLKAEDIQDVNQYHHITLLYGFDPKHFWQVKKLAECAGPFGADFQFGQVRDGDRDPVKFVPIRSPTLQTCFDVLSSTFPNQHYVHNNEYVPHVTLCTMKKM